MSKEEKVIYVKGKKKSSIVKGCGCFTLVVVLLIVYIVVRSAPKPNSTSEPTPPKVSDTERKIPTEIPQAPAKDEVEDVKSGSEQEKTERTEQEKVEKDFQQKMEEIDSKIKSLETTIEEQRWHTWTDISGRTIRAGYRGTLNGKINIEKEDGKKYDLLPEKLSEQDLEWIKEHSKEKKKIESEIILLKKDKEDWIRAKKNADEARIREEERQSRIKGVTMSGYRAIQIGMTYAQVAEVIGEDGKELSRNQIADIETVLIQFGEGGILGRGIIHVCFQNGYVTSKSQSGF
ncbi:MAG: hypothetical protein LBQ54_14895 [Planctomycetaceae bacterium]|jgi:hypothetical protein|nr:hypothetical protein [Planctomycetaceae bacterium]